MGKKAKDKGGIQYGALPYRVVDGKVEVLLVTSRGTGRWVIPKGWPMKDRKPHQAAKQEAYEEAGLVGCVGSKQLGTFEYGKRLGPSRTITCAVTVFPLEVSRQLETWPEQDQREVRWFPLEDAASAVQERDLGNLIRWLPDMVDVGGFSA